MKNLIIFWSVVVIAGFVGWCMNIAAIWNATEITGMIVVRAIGVFVMPLGAVLGYL